MRQFKVTAVVETSAEKNQIKDYVKGAVESMLDNGAFFTGQNERLVSIHIEDQGITTGELKTLTWALTFDKGVGGRYRCDIDPAVCLGWLKKQKGIQNYMLYQAILKEDTNEDDLKKMLSFWNTTDMGGLSQATDLTEDDKQLIEDKLVGWVQIPYVHHEVKEKLKNKTQ